MRFRLSTLFLAMAVVATSLSLAGSWGCLVAGYVFVLIICLRACIRCPSNKDLERLFTVLLTIGLCVLAIAVTVESPERPHRAQCANNLKQIGFALDGYRSTYGCFPPPYLTDARGKRVHSWRVLILPYLEQQALYSRYSFSEPWDGPSNCGLLNTGPTSWPYVCPSDREAYLGRKPITSYLAVVGPGTIWNDPTWRKEASDSRPRKCPVMVVETLNAGVNWMEPKDLTFEDLAAGVNPRSGVGFSSKHTWPGANVLFADGSVSYLPSTASPRLLRQLVTDGMDDATRTEIDNLFAKPPSRRDPWWPRFFSCLATIVVLLIHGVIYEVRTRGKTPTGAKP